MAKILPTEKTKRRERFIISILLACAVGTVLGAVIGTAVNTTIDEKNLIRVDPNHPCAGCYEACINDYSP